MLVFLHQSPRFIDNGLQQAAGQTITLSGAVSVDPYHSLASGVVTLLHVGLTPKCYSAVALFEVYGELFSGREQSLTSTLAGVQALPGLPLPFLRPVMQMKIIRLVEETVTEDQEELVQQPMSTIKNYPSQVFPFFAGNFSSQHNVVLTECTVFSSCVVVHFILQCIFLFSLTWSIGATSDSNSRQKFDAVIRELMQVGALQFLF